MQARHVWAFLLFLPNKCPGNVWKYFAYKDNVNTTVIESANVAVLFPDISGEGMEYCLRKRMPKTPCLATRSLMLHIQRANLHCRFLPSQEMLRAIRAR